MTVHGPPSVADAKRHRRLPGRGKNPRAGRAPRDGGARGPRAIPQLTRNPEMPAFKMSAARISAGLAASAFFTPASAQLPPLLVVNDESAARTSRSPPGFTYVVTAAPTAASTSPPTASCSARTSTRTSRRSRDRSPSCRSTATGALPVARTSCTVGYNGGDAAASIAAVDRPAGLPFARGAAGRNRLAAHRRRVQQRLETKTVEQFTNLDQLDSRRRASTGRNPNWARCRPIRARPTRRSAGRKSTKTSRAPPFPAQRTAARRRDHARADDVDRRPTAPTSSMSRASMRASVAQTGDALARGNRDAGRLRARRRGSVRR